jgi:tetratricopeptide (TPR) repeat protein
MTRSHLLRVAISLAFLSLGIGAFQFSASAHQSKSSGGREKPQSFGQLSQAANLARNENRDDDAIRMYSQALKLQPDWQEGLWYLGTLLYEKEDFSHARDVLRRFVAVAPKEGPGWAVLGMSEFQTREYPRSLDHLQRALAIGLGDRKDLGRSAQYFQAVILTRLERYDDSMTVLGSLHRSSENPDLLVEPIGLAALRIPLLPSEIPPDHRDLIRMAGQGSLSIESEHQDETERVFSEMVAHYPNEPGVHFLYGVYLMDVRPEEGIREMKRELEISPFHLGARLRIAEEYIKEVKFEDALQFAEEAIKLEANNAQAHMILGEALIGKGDTAKGIAELETARKDSPDSVRTHWDLLRAYTSVGRSVDAKREKEEIERLNRLDPQQVP